MSKVAAKQRKAPEARLCEWRGLNGSAATLCQAAWHGGSHGRQHGTAAVTARDNFDTLSLGAPRSGRIRLHSTQPKRRRFARSKFSHAVAAA